MADPISNELIFAVLASLHANMDRIHRRLGFPDPALSHS
jgi:hypothetical protein